MKWFNEWAKHKKNYCDGLKSKVIIDYLCDACINWTINDLSHNHCYDIETGNFAFHDYDCCCFTFSSTSPGAPSMSTSSNCLVENGNVQIKFTRNQKQVTCDTCALVPLQIDWGEERTERRHYFFEQLIIKI